MVGRKSKTQLQGPSLNRVREIRLARGWSLEELAARIGQGWNKDKVSRIERGKGFEVFEMPIVAAALGVSAAELLPGAVDQVVFVKASIGDGGAVMELSSQDSMGISPVKLSGVVDPRMATGGIVSNGALAPIVADGAVLIWNRDERVRPDLLQGQLCYLELRDGRTFVRTIVNAERGRYHLLGAGQPMLNADVIWAAPIIAILPPSRQVAGGGDHVEHDEAEAPAHYGEWGQPVARRSRA